MDPDVKLPSFLIVGAAKCGTTSLHHYLLDSGVVEMPLNKETHFFSDEVSNCNSCKVSGPYGSRRIENLEEYKAQFSNSKNLIKGEACVSYLYFYENSVRKIKQILGDPKIIIILRNPFQRSFSNYMHHVRDGFEKQTYKDAIKQINERKRNKWWWGYDYIGASLYFNSVKHYIENFSNVRIVIFEDFIKSPLDTLKEIHEFLGIPFQNSIYENLNEKVYNKTYVPKFPFLMRLIRTHRLIGAIAAYLKGSLFFSEIKKFLISNRKISNNFFSDDLDKLLYQDVERLSSLLNINLSEKWFKK